MWCCNCFIQFSNVVQSCELSQGSEHIVKMLNSGKGGQMIFEPAVLKVYWNQSFKVGDAAHNSASIEGMLPDGANDGVNKDINGFR